MSNVGECPRVCTQVKKEKRKIRGHLFTSSIKLEIRHFHVVVVRSDGEEMYKKSEMHVQSCFFLSINLLLLWRSRCRRRRVVAKAPLIAREL